MANIEQNLSQTNYTSEKTFFVFSFPLRVLERRQKDEI